MVDLKKRILEIAYKHKLGHLGSYLSAAEIVDEIYKNKNSDDIFILSSGHAALALYAALEKYEGKNAEELFLKHGGHPHRDEENGIYCSTGSLGLGITVAVGRALANKNRKVHVLISDGESAEGSVWESLRFIKESNLSNIEVYFNINGYAAYDKVDVKYLDFSYSRVGQDVRYALNDDKLRNIGWSPKKVFDEELPEIVKYYKENFVW